MYSGFGLECKVEDLESLKQYKYRLKIQQVDNSSNFAVSDWLPVTTEKDSGSLLPNYYRTVDNYPYLLQLNCSQIIVEKS